MRSHQFWTPLGVRLRAHRRVAGDLNWLFLPGGPGLGSESLIELVDAVAVAGTSWLVDLPGDGSNTLPPGAPPEPYHLWPDVLVEAAAAVANPVFVAHSTGGMYVLSVPALEGYLRGLVLISTAPDSGLLTGLEELTRTCPLPAVAAAADRYDRRPTAENLRDLTVASAPWSFTAEGIAPGLDLLKQLPYNPQAAGWSADHFDRSYVSSWWPRAVPTLVLSGSCDRIINPSIWDDARYAGEYVRHRTIRGGGHFPWLERPDEVRFAFAELEISTADTQPPGVVRETVGRSSSDVRPSICAPTTTPLDHAGN